jgi:hypothetical protein
MASIEGHSLRTRKMLRRRVRVIGHRGPRGRYGHAPPEGENCCLLSGLVARFGLRPIRRSKAVHRRSIEIRNGNDHRILRAIARKLIEKGLDGDLPSIREIADRLDGKCTQVIERGDLPVDALTDAELYAIIRGGSREPLDVPALLKICGPHTEI